MLAAGIPLETILAEAGEDAEMLRPLLQTADETQTLRAVPVPPPDASLRKMLAYSETLSTGTQAAPPVSPGLLNRLANPFKTWGQSFVLTGTRMATLTAMVMFVFLAGTVLGSSITLAAQDSLPGQSLYGLKRLTETMRLGITWNETILDQLQETYNQRRRMETNLLLKQGQEASVVFETNIRSVDGTTLQLDGLVIHITPDTVINGELTPGTRIQLEAITQPPDTLVALTLTVIDPAPVVAPTSTSTPTPTLTVTPTITPTATSTPTATPGISQDTDTLSMPTATPLSSSENSDDSDDDNEDEDNSDDDDEKEDGDDDANDNDDDNDNENEESDDDASNENEDENENDDEASENEDEDENENEDNSGSNDDDDEEDNSGKGNSDDPDDDDKDDDKDDD
jgi:hypothetical protein